MINQIKSLDNRAGTDLTGEEDLDSVMRTSNLDFEVEKVPMYTPEGNQVTDKYLLRRTDNKFVLGTCGKRYHVVENEKMFAPFDQLVKDHGAT